MQPTAKGEKEQGRRIDVTAALGEAGHEVEDLGYEEVPDSGPVIEEHDDKDRAPRLEAALDIAATNFPPDC